LADRLPHTWKGTALEACILRELTPGYGHFKHNILDALSHSFSRSSVSRCMTDMRKRGLIRYAEGGGYWYAPLARSQP
jgi:hypothetical protein